MTTTVSEGISNWERMKDLVADARAADPAWRIAVCVFPPRLIVAKMPRLRTSPSVLSFEKTANFNDEVNFEWCVT